MVAVAVFQMVKIDVPRPIVTAIATPPTSVKPQDLRIKRRPSFTSSPPTSITDVRLRKNRAGGEHGGSSVAAFRQSASVMLTTCSQNQIHPRCSRSSARSPAIASHDLRT